MELQKIYDKLAISFNINNAKERSFRERQECRREDDFKLAYGEITFRPLCEMILLAKKKFGLGQGGVFLDLGHGTGKAVMAAALSHRWHQVRGIELL